MHVSQYQTYLRTNISYPLVICHSRCTLFPEYLLCMLLNYLNLMFWGFFGCWFCNLVVSQPFQCVKNYHIFLKSHFSKVQWGSVMCMCKVWPLKQEGHELVWCVLFFFPREEKWFQMAFSSKDHNTLLSFKISQHSIWILSRAAGP